MKKNLQKKYLAMAIIFLLLVINIIPSICANIEIEKIVYDSKLVTKHNDETIVVEKSKIILYISFEKPEIIDKIIHNTTFSSILLQNLPFSREYGKPLLPVKSVNLLLPPGSNVKNVQVDKEIKEIEGEFFIEPAGEIMINSTDVYSGIFVDPIVYNSSNFFPRNTYEIAGVERFRGYHILTVNLYPVQYNPKKRTLYYCKNITLNLEIEENGKVKNLFRGLSEDKEVVSNKVINPSMANEYIHFFSKNSKAKSDSIFRKAEELRI